ncbi:MAG: hypothetical protein RR954_06160 [Christensenellaceae bacterium]
MKQIGLLKALWLVRKADRMTEEKRLDLQNRRLRELVSYGYTFDIWREYDCYQTLRIQYIQKQKGLSFFLRLHYYGLGAVEYLRICSVTI